jgi:hypothetical protein
MGNRAYTPESVTSAYNERNKTAYTPKELFEYLYCDLLLSAETIGCEHVFVSKWVVYGFLDELGIPIREKGWPVGRTGYQKRLNNIPKDKLLDMRRADILAAVGCSNGYLSQLIDKFGVEYKRGRYRIHKKHEIPKAPAIRGRGLSELIDARHPV